MGPITVDKILSSQTSGVFIVWKIKSGNGARIVASFLRKIPKVTMESQINKALIDGRNQSHVLVGIGFWQLQPIILWRSMPLDKVFQSQSINMTVNRLTASLLLPRNLPEREHLLVQQGAKEMREKWIPYICSELRRILRESYYKVRN